MSANFIKNKHRVTAYIARYIADFIHNGAILAFMISFAQFFGFSSNNVGYSKSMITIRFPPITPNSR